MSRLARRRRYGDEIVTQAPDGGHGGLFLIAGLGVVGTAIWYFFFGPGKTNGPTTTVSNVPIAGGSGVGSIVTGQPIPSVPSAPQPLKPPKIFKAFGSGGGSTTLMVGAMATPITQAIVTMAETNQPKAIAEAAANKLSGYNQSSVTPAQITPAVAPIGPAGAVESQRDLLVFQDGTQMSVSTFPSVAASTAAWNVWMSDAIRPGLTTAVGAPSYIAGQPAILLDHSGAGSAEAFRLAANYVPGYVVGLFAGKG